MVILALAAMLFLQVAGPPRPPDGVIEGQIRSIDGTPAVGLRVTALSLPESGGKSDSSIAGIGQTDNSGRFRLENVASGKYHIMAGALDVASYYPGVKTASKARVVTMTGGATVSGVDFKLARPLSVRVSGIVKGLPPDAPPGLVRAILGVDEGHGQMLNVASQTAPVQSDGTFEFGAVLPGSYFVRLTGATNLQETAKIHVNEKNVSIEMKRRTALFVGRVSVDDGSPLPTLLTTPPQLNVGGAQDAMSAVQLRFRRTGPASEKGNVAQFQASVFARADGYFVFEGTAGEYEIAGQQMPMGYYIKDSRQDREASRFHVTLTTTPPASEPQGVTVSGRIAGLAAGAEQPKGIRIQTVNRGSNFPGQAMRVMETPIGADGTFAVRGVPPGTISLSILMPTNIGNSPLQMRIDVADRDIALELSVVSGPAPRK